MYSSKHTCLKCRNWKFSLVGFFLHHHPMSRRRCTAAFSWSLSCYFDINFLVTRCQESDFKNGNKEKKWHFFFQRNLADLSPPPLSNHCPKDQNMTNEPAKPHLFSTSFTAVSYLQCNAHNNCISQTRSLLFKCSYPAQYPFNMIWLWSKNWQL